MAVKTVDSLDEALAPYQMCIRDSNENALKLASFYNGRKRVLSLSKAFHGRTSLAVEATDNPKIIAPINANGHVTYLPLNDLDAFKVELAKGDVCAVIVECIQGVGGIRLATAEFMQGVRQADVYKRQL